ncbi:hypothetical protein P4O66_000883 [Electrophorus voltai]|uniref:Integrase catalytic domain-containing protein n=1 Tax=Electrophorus voltai TaxID=2609070 RepID=A0AAD8ZFB2_9TELE|nr:hypothetical protein P4O66_000883 [Electrophorus voltai]
MDRFSKMVRLVPLVALPTAWETADQLFRQIFRQFGLPKYIVSDRGSQFTSRVWKVLLGKLNIIVSLMSGYHPQANGQVERVNQELGKFLHLYCNYHPETWSTYLPWAKYAQNSLRHTGTGLTPFECVLGYQLPLYPWNVPTSDQLEVERWCRESEQTWEEMHQNLRREITVYKRKADKKRGETPKYELWQKVWVSTKDSQAGTTGKLKARYEGPYSITGRVNELEHFLSQYCITPHTTVVSLAEMPIARRHAKHFIAGSPWYRLRALMDWWHLLLDSQYLIWTKKVHC